MQGRMYHITGQKGHIPLLCVRLCVKYDTSLHHAPVRFPEQFWTQHQAT